MLDGGSIPPRSTKSVSRVREQHRNVFVDPATWNDSLLFALWYAFDGPDQVSTAWASKDGNTRVDWRNQQKSLDAKTSKLGTVKVAMGKNFRFGSRTEAVAA